MSRSLSGSKGQGMKERAYWASFLWLYGPSFKHYARLTTSIHLIISQMFAEYFSCALRSFGETQRKNRNWLQFISVTNLENSDLTNACSPCRFCPEDFEMSHLAELYPRRQERSHRQGAQVTRHLSKYPRNCSHWSPTLKPLSEVPSKSSTHKNVSNQEQFTTGLMQKSQNKWSVGT